MGEQQQRRRSSLPYRESPKHVVFSAIVRTNNDPIDEKTRYDTTSRLSGDRYASGHSQQYHRPSGYVFDGVPTLIPTPWESERRPVKRWSWPLKQQQHHHHQHHVEKSRHKTYSRLFNQLPEEIHRLILEHVTALHDTGAGVCVDCLLHDMCSFSLVNKQWHEATNHHMYSTIWLPVCQRATLLKRRSRPKLLLRTLQERPDLASRVRRLYAALTHDEKQSEQAGQVLRAELASIIRTCPSLQAVNGVYPEDFVGEAPDELNAALTSREDLREYLWLLEGREHQSQPLYPSMCHQKTWKNLETLVIRDNGSVISQGGIYSILRQLPALQHLALIGLTSSAFHDGTLQALTGLKSLRLEMLEGLTDLGLAQPLPRLAGTLQNLSLIDLDIKSLRTITKLLFNFNKLRRLTVVQDSPPGLPLGADVTLAVASPLLSSRSLTSLHWELLVPGSANQALESSMRSGGFPALRRLRAPCDADGVLQSLCRPVPRRAVSLAETTHYRTHDANEGYTRDLALARTAAQLRTRGSSGTPGTPAVSVVIQEEGYVQYTQVMGRYLGDIRSSVTYDLDPDFEGSRQALGRVADVLDTETSECQLVHKKGKRKHVVMRRRELTSLF